VVAGFGEVNDNSIGAFRDLKDRLDLKLRLLDMSRKPRSGSWDTNHEQEWFDGMIFMFLVQATIFFATGRTTTIPVRGTRTCAEVHSDANAQSCLHSYPILLKNPTHFIHLRFVLLKNYFCP